MYKKNLMVNSEAIDDDFICSFISTPDGLPILLMNILEEFDEDIELKRFNIYKIHPDFEILDKKEILITSDLLKKGKFSEADDFQIDYALDFLEKHPKFKPMIKEAQSQSVNDFKIMLRSIREAFFGDIDYF